MRIVSQTREVINVFCSANSSNSVRESKALILSHIISCCHVKLELLIIYICIYIYAQTFQLLWGLHYVEKPFFNDFLYIYICL